MLLRADSSVTDRLRLCFAVESGVDVRLVEGLAARFDVTILARKIEGGTEISHPPATPVRTIVGPASRLGFARLVWSHLHAEHARYDAVVVQGYSIAALAANSAGRQLGLPVVMLICSPVEEYYRCRRMHRDPSKPYRWRELLGLRALGRLNAMVGERYFVLSQHLEDVVRGHGGRRVDHVPVYGVDTRRFSPLADGDRAALRARLGLPASGGLIFFSSRVAPEKDAETLLRAFRSLLDAGRDLWLLHRSGGYRTFLADAERFGVAHRVIATDAVHPNAGLADDYRACDVCVQASRAEGLGFSALEALACGLPVIAAAVGGLRETIVDGRTGWTYRVGDADALAAQLVDVLDHPDEARRRALAGRELVRSTFDRELVFARFEQLVREAVAERGRRGSPTRQAGGAVAEHV
jgi:glycosyltransferase involved in cell wall biosynthesis